MSKPCAALVFFVLVFSGLALTVPAEDVPETAYDESEVLPFLGVSLTSGLIPQVCGTARSVRSVPRHDLPDTGRGFHTRDAAKSEHPTVSTRVALAKRCTFLC